MRKLHFRHHRWSLSVAFRFVFLLPLFRYSFEKIKSMPPFWEFHNLLGANFNLAHAINSCVKWSEPSEVTVPITVTSSCSPTSLPSPLLWIEMKCMRVHSRVPLSSGPQRSGPGRVRRTRVWMASFAAPLKKCIEKAITPESCFN